MEKVPVDYFLTLLQLIHKLKLVFIDKPSFRSIVPMAAIYYSDPICMEFHMKYYAYRKSSI